MSNPTFSIIAPVYKMKNNLGEKFLVEYLSHLTLQTYKNFEVIVSDQSPDNNYEQICHSFLNALDIRYVKNNSGVANAANNVNHAIRHATGEIVKLLYVDDFFVDFQALEKIKNAFDNNPLNHWLISGFIQSDQERKQYYNSRMPNYHMTNLLADTNMVPWERSVPTNVTGNPSNYAVRRRLALEMDESLLWIVDGEYFYRSYYHYGDPIMIKEILVCFREHNDSAFHKPELQQLGIVERKFCVDKYSRPVEHKLL